MSLEEDFNLRKQIIGFPGSSSTPVTSDEVDTILHDALERAKEGHRQARKDAWIASAPQAGGVAQIEGSPRSQTASMRELATAAERYSDFLIHGRIPEDLKTKQSSALAGAR
jgi:hypothetical protein